MASLFISYSRKDIEIAHKLTKAFEGQGLDYWIDWEGIPPTVDWWKEIEKGIEEADIFLFLISPDSASSTVCRQEIEHAAKNGKRLIPVVVQDIQAEESPTELRPLNWTFIREKDDFDAGFKNLITAIQTDYAWVQSHRQLQVKALEWERSRQENSFLLRGKELQDAEIQLVANSSKQPHPTNLQRAFVLKSRRATDRQRRSTIGVAVAGLIIVAALAIYGFLQAKLATDRANNTLARQLAAQAQTIFATGNSKQDIAVLLAAQAMQISPVADAAEVLQNNTLAYPVSSAIYGGEVLSLAFSPDGKYVVSRGCDLMGSFTHLVEIPSCEQYSLRLWESSTGKEVTRITSATSAPLASFTPDGRHLISTDGLSIRMLETSSGKEFSSFTNEKDRYTIAFSSDGKYVVSGGCDKINEVDFSCMHGNATVWETASGKEIAHLEAQDAVSYVAFSPDGRYVIWSSHDNTAHLWEVTTGQEVARITHSDPEYYSIAFSSDSKYLVSIGADNAARVWDIITGREIARMIHDRGLTVLAISPDGRYVASGSDDNTARVWEMGTGTEIARMTHNGGVTTVAFSPNGKYVVSGGWDNTARVWEATTGKEVARIAHEDQVTTVVFSQDGKYVLSGSRDHTARVWETSTGNEVSRMTHGEEVFFVRFSPNDEYAISGGCDRKDQACLMGSVRVWETSIDRQVAHTHYDGGVTSIAFSPDAEYAVTGGCEKKGEAILCTQGDIVVSKIATGKEIAHMAFEGNIISLAFSSDGKYLISGSDDKTARVWEVATGKEVARMTHEAAVRAVAFSPEGKYVISAGTFPDDTLRVWEATTGKEIAHITDFFYMVKSVAFSPDGKSFVVGSSGNASVWETATGKEIAHMTPESEVFVGDVSLVKFSPDGKYVLSISSDDHTARVWEAATGKEIYSTMYDGGVSSVAFSADSKFVVSGGCNIRAVDIYFCTQSTARIWEIVTGNEVASMTSDGDIFSVAFSPDDKYIASGGEDNIVYVWEAANGRLAATMTHDDDVIALAFSRDGRYVVSVSDDNIIQTGFYRPEDLILDACTRVSRNLTLSEWNQYVGDALPYQKICPSLPIEPESIPAP